MQGNVIRNDAFLPCLRRVNKGINKGRWAVSGPDTSTSAAGAAAGLVPSIMMRETTEPEPTAPNSGGRLGQLPARARRQGPRRSGRGMAAAATPPAAGA